MAASGIWLARGPNVDEGQQRSTLQLHLKAAMAARKAGDLEQARASLDAALAIDPRFTAARLMRESLGESAGAELPPAEKPAAAEPDTNKPDATAKADTYGLLEARAQHRRLDQRIGVARTASASRRLAEPTAALDEVVEQDPALSALPEMAAVQVAAQTSVQRRRLLSVTAASVVGIALGLVIGVALGLVIVSRPDIAAEPTQTAQTEYATPARPETDAQPETPAPRATTGPGEATAPAETTASAEARAAAETTAPAAPTPAKATAQQESAASHERTVRSENTAPHPVPVPSVPAPAPPSAAVVTRSVRPPFTDGDRAARDKVTPSRTRDVAPGETTPPSLAIVEPPRPPSPAASPPAPTVAEPRAASPPAADAAAASVPVAVAASVPASNEDRLIWETLQRYRRAYNALDARLVHAICPGLDETALAHAFEGLLSQSLEFESCSLDTQQDSARAVCRGSARYVARVGNRTPRAERLVWAFRLNKSNGNWTITSAWTDR
jgi:hypothetical protein